MDVTKQHFGVFILKIHMMVRFWGDVFFESVFSPKGLTKNSHNYESVKVFGYYRLSNGSTYSHMQMRCTKTPQMHSNTSPTSLKAPESENTNDKHNTFNNLKLALETAGSKAENDFTKKNAPEEKTIIVL